MGETGGRSLVLSGQGGGRLRGRADQKDGVPGEAALQTKNGGAARLHRRFFHKMI
ncbi:MAG: hypothetical protein KHZ10_03025 [Clostridium sp.]|nr:hypothetical protein [Clostridium sp.]MDU3119383.1 hypothetical protein [Clostridium sp.]